MKKLVIVESPAKAKTIEKYLGSGYKIKASMGHLRDLPKKEMGVDTTDHFRPTYIPIEGKDKLIKELKNEVKDAGMVYLATDPDREGEAISWHLKELLSLEDDKTRRITFNEITKKAVTEAVEHPRDIDIDLVNAQQARRILDRLVGYKLSPFLWRKVRRGLSAGRVQSVVTRLLVDRENEIRDFKPEEYWTIDVLLSAESQSFTAHFFGGMDQKKMELKNEEEAGKVLENIKDKTFSVFSIKRAQKKKSPAPPFITSTLQQEASRRLNMTARRTMAIAQELYEGIEITGQGMTGLITYMRTDSLRLSQDALDGAKSYIREKFGEGYYPQKTRVFKTKNQIQDAHEAIRPSNVALTPDSIKQDLTSDQFKLYRLIWSRFLASQMSDAIFDTITADINAGSYMFRANGSRIKFPGFTALYEEKKEDAEDSASESLPELSEEQALKHEKTEPKQHFTQPPPRYTEASLIHTMEEKGIGRPSTYAPTISTVLDREYAVKEGKALRPTTLGEAVTGLMLDKFNDIIDIQFTANMENDLDEVESGKVDFITILEAFYNGFSAELDQAEKDLEKQRIKVKDEETDIKCELCGRNMVIKSGRFGKFLACPGYPECKNTKPITEDTGALCPKCGGKILKKKAKSGYSYYGCEKNPTCDFMTWDKPLNQKCPQCGNFLFKRTTKQERKILCQHPGCGYEQELKPPAKEGAAAKHTKSAKPAEKENGALKPEKQTKATKEKTAKSTARSETKGTAAKAGTKAKSSVKTKAKDTAETGTKAKSTTKKAKKELKS